MLDWKDLGLLLIGAALGAFLSTFHSYFVKRPKLRVDGGGSGGGPGPGFHVNRITVRNAPGLVGLSLGDTRLFGFRLHRRIQIGLIVERSPARECRAYLYDKETQQFISQLWWQLPDGSVADVVTISSGERAEVLVFARLDSEKLKYFVYRPNHDSGDKIVVPDEDQKFDSTREFQIELQHSYGRKRIRIDFKMIRGFDGRLNYQFKRGGSGGGGSF